MKITQLIMWIVTLVLALSFPIKIRAISSEEIVMHINQTRLIHGRHELLVDSKLQYASTMKLSDIAQYRYWAHNNPITRATWVSFVRKAGFWGHVGENLARNFSDSNHVVTAWMNSPTHKANILNPYFSYIGIDVGNVEFDSGIETVIVVEFGAKRQ